MHAINASWTRTTSHAHGQRRIVRMQRLVDPVNGSLHANNVALNAYTCLAARAMAMKLIADVLDREVQDWPEATAPDAKSLSAPLGTAESAHGGSRRTGLPPSRIDPPGRVQPA